MNIHNTDLSKKSKSKSTSKSKTIKKIWDAYDNAYNNDMNECSLIIQHNAQMCVDCESLLQLGDEGLLTCSNTKCCRIYTNTLDQGAEWRYYGNEDGGVNPSRCGIQSNIHDEDNTNTSLGCKVNMSGKYSFQMYKIKKYIENMNIANKEKNKYEIYNIIAGYANTLNLSKNIVDDAIIYYNKIVEDEKSFRSKNKQGIILNSIILSCNKNNITITTKELSQRLKVDSKILTKSNKIYRNIINNMEKNVDEEDKTTFVEKNYLDFIERYCTLFSPLLNNSCAEITMVCKYIACKVINLETFAGYTDPTLAAGIVYYVLRTLKFGVNKDDVQKVCNMSKGIIDKCYKSITSLPNMLPDVIYQKYVSI